MNYDEIVLSEDSVCLNAQVMCKADFGRSLDWLDNNFPDQESCPYCQSILVHQYKQDSCGDLDYSEKFVSLKTCPYCKYWQWHDHDPLSINSYGCPDHYECRTISKVREFETRIPEGCYSDLVVALRQNPDLWHTLNPTDFEKLVQAIFKANYCDCEVFHVGKPNDGGVDVIFVDSGKKQWLIQAKRRVSPQSSEGVETIRNMLGTMYLEDSSFGVVVSTADHFTYQAYKQINRADELGKTLKLIDRGKLIRMSGALLPSNPWKEYLEITYDPNIAGNFA